VSIDSERGTRAPARQTYVATPPKLDPESWIQREGEREREREMEMESADKIYIA